MRLLLCLQRASSASPAPLRAPSAALPFPQTHPVPGGLLLQRSSTHCGCPWPWPPRPFRHQSGGSKQRDGAVPAVPPRGQGNGVGVTAAGRGVGTRRGLQGRLCGGPGDWGGEAGPPALPAHAGFFQFHLQLQCHFPTTTERVTLPERSSSEGQQDERRGHDLWRARAVGYSSPPTSLHSPNTQGATVAPRPSSPPSSALPPPEAVPWHLPCCPAEQRCLGAAQCHWSLVVATLWGAWPQNAVGTGGFGGSTVGPGWDSGVTPGVPCGGAGWSRGAAGCPSLATSLGLDQGSSGLWWGHVGAQGGERGP